MKKFILGLTTCVALVSGTCLFSGCTKNDEALANVTNEWNEIKKNSYVGEDGLFDYITINYMKGVVLYREKFEFDGTNKVNINSLSTLLQPNFLANVMTPLAEISNLSKATYKESLPKKDLKNLSQELKDLNVALSNYTNHVDNMQKTLNANSNLLNGDLIEYQSLASIVISEAFEATDIYIDMLYNNAVNCNIADNAGEVSSQVANLVTYKLSNELAHTFYSIYYDLTNFEYLRIATDKNPGSYFLNSYESTEVTTYPHPIKSSAEIKKIKDMQNNIAPVVNARKIIENIADNFDYEAFKQNFITHYSKDAMYRDKNSDDDIYLQDECIQKYSSEKDYAMYLNLSNLISVDLNLAMASYYNAADTE